MTTTIRVSDDTKARLERLKRDDETFSEAVDRLLGEWSLLDFAEADAPIDPKTHRELLDEIDRQDIEETKQRLRNRGVDPDE